MGKKSIKYELESQSNREKLLISPSSSSSQSYKKAKRGKKGEKLTFYPKARKLCFEILMTNVNKLTNENSTFYVENFQVLFWFTDFP